MHAEVGAIWRERAQSELNAASGFAIVATELFELGAPSAVLELATRAVHDEVRHAELCRGLAERYLGEPVAPPVAKRVSMPRHAGADAELVKHLHVVGLCCVNETLAAGFLEACLEATDAPDVRELARQHLADEVRHARVGWAHLAWVDAATRRAIGGFVPRMLTANVARWTRRLHIMPRAGFPGLGVPARARALASLEETVREVVLPGFAAVGVPL
ncbi:MAG: diiron oxygenase [Sandaracinaceae bacterium]|nr:diiron oxygenase [Sandaracinaceae bacterium]